MRRSRHICRNWCRRSQKIRALRSICLNVGKETMYTAALERGAVEPFLLCGNGRICIGRKHPQVHRTSEQSVLILWRRGNTAVKENIHKGQPGICEPHRAYVRCSIQALELRTSVLQRNWDRAVSGLVLSEENS